ncbi:MAG: fibrobacter succinogenes major paralogous domain-containing protein [Bacteroidales bacterium]|jgi:uncharacterized protein (TIGR02145 family)|nr:fibrobacter succinogenes major paralogous domain-containing protein [Bacteroidales bacterium]
MKKTSLLLAAIALCVCACHREDPPEGYMEHQGTLYPKPVPVQFDSNGDGVIDASDASIGVLGANLQADQTPNGGALFRGESEGVSNGVRYCYQNVERNCDAYGSLYSMETALNGSWEKLQQQAKENMTDKNGNGVWDYIDDITSSPSYINTVSLAYSGTAAKEFVEKLAAAIAPQAPAPATESVMQQAIYRVMTEVLTELFAANKTYVDVTAMQESVFRNVESIVISTVIAPENEWMDPSAQLDAIATAVARTASSGVSSRIAGDVVAQIKKESASHSYTQGLCPGGFHIPSDADWILFELALGMSPADAMQSGIEVTNRGAAAYVVQKMVDTHGFAYSGYMTENELYTQNGDAGVFVSSSVGEDENGKFMWVRQIDKSYSGVVRYKHYKPSGLSVRCFQN